MATSINTAFTAQWSDEVKQAYQQNKSKLRGTVREVNNVVGSTYNFHKLAAITANTKARDAALTYINPGQTLVTATLADSYAPILLDKLDEYKTNASFRSEFTSAAAAALARKTDTTVIAAMEALNTNPATLSGVFSLARLTEALTLLNGIDAAPEDRTLVVGASVISDAMAISQLTSSDFVTMQAIQNGGVGAALGFKWVMSNLLTKNALDANGGAAANQRHCFAFHKQAVGLAIGQDVKTTIDWNEERYAWSIVSSMSMGAVGIEQAGIIELCFTDTSGLA